MVAPGGAICASAIFLMTLASQQGASAQDPGRPPPPTAERAPQIGCVYVQYCDYPSHEAGTVCRTYPGCSISDATVAECEQDIVTVCGESTDPVWFCNQSSTTCELPSADEPNPPTDPSLPFIHNFSGASSGRVLELVRAALDGLGFDQASGQGPVPQDRVFVGNRYLAWIDQTGFFGKMNGLWMLNAEPGDGLKAALDKDHDDN